VREGGHAMNHFQCCTHKSTSECARTDSGKEMKRDIFRFMVEVGTPPLGQQELLTNLVPERQTMNLEEICENVKVIVPLLDITAFIANESDW
jgi:hypothetical protein